MALAALLATVGIGTGLASPASAGFGGACYAGGATHCYTDIHATEFSPRATRIRSMMNYQCLIKPSGFSGWSSVETMWAAIDLAANGGADGFVENGIWNQQSNVTFYWVRHGGTYGTGYQIYETGVAAGANNSHEMVTQWNSNNTWTIYTRGVQRGLLSSPAGPIRQGQTGGEATTNSGSHNFNTWGLQRVQNAVTYASWPGGGASTYWQSPPWANPPTSYSDSGLQTRKIATGAAC